MNTIRTKTIIWQWQTPSQVVRQRQCVNVEHWRQDALHEDIAWQHALARLGAIRGESPGSAHEATPAWEAAALAASRPSPGSGPQSPPRAAPRVERRTACAR